MNNQQEQETTAIATKQAETPRTGTQDTHVINAERYLKYDFTGEGNITYPLVNKNDSKPFGFLSLDLDWREVKSAPFIEAFSFSLTRTREIDGESNAAKRQVTNADSALAKLARPIVTGKRIQTA